MTNNIEMKRPCEIRKTLGQGQEKRSKSLTDDAFVDIKQALEDALAFERRERSDLKVTRIRLHDPNQIRRAILLPIGKI